MEAAPKKSELLYQNIVEFQSELICRYDANFRLTFANRAYSEAQQTTPEALIGADILSRIPIEDRATAITHVRSLTVEKPVAVSVHQSILPDGSRRWIEWTDRAIFDAHGQLVEYQGIGRDITERKAIEDMLRLLQAAVQNNNDAIIITDRSDTIIFVNRAFTLIFGYSADEVIGQTPSLIFDQRAEIETPITPRINPQSGNRFLGEAKIKHKAGGELFVEWSTSPIRDESGEDNNFVTILRDVTERKRQESLQMGFRQVFEAIAENQPLTAILEKLVRCIENYQRGVRASVLMLDAETRRLHNGVAPSLPEAYNAAIEGLQIGPGIGSCGTAAYEKRLVIVEDIQVDPFWAQFRDLAARHNLRACWSQPIFNHDGSVLGTFALYYSQPQRPNEDELELIQSAAHIAGIAIRRKQAEEFLRASEARLKSLIDSQTNFVLRTDLEGRYSYYNDKFARDFGWLYSNGIDGANALSSICEHHHQRTQDAVNRCIADPGKAIKVELDKPAQSGGIRTTLWEFVCLTDSSGAPTEIQCVGIDISDRKRAEAALRESEERFRQFMRYFPGTVCVFDHLNYLQYCNGQYAKSVGQEPEDVLLKHIDTFLRPETAQKARDENSRVLAQNAALEVNYRASDDKRWLIVKFPIPSEFTPPMIGAIGVDVTKEKHAEEALQRAKDLLEERVIERTAELERVKNRLEAIFNNSADAILLLNVKKGIQQANSAFETLFGYTSQSALGLSLPALVHPAGALAVESIVKDAATAHQTHHIEVQANRADGTYFDAEISISPVNRSNTPITSLVCVVHDVTARKQAEAAIQKFAAEVHDLYNNAPTAYHSLNAEGVVVQISDTELRWLGYSREEVVGKLNFPDLLTPASLATFRVTFPVFKQQGWSKDVELEIKRKDGTTFWGLLNATAVYDSDGQFMYSRSTLVDITELKQAQQAIDEERNLLRTLINSTPDFIYIKDLQHRFVLSNTSHAHARGVKSPNDLLGKSDADFFEPPMVDRFYEEEEEIFRSGIPMIAHEQPSLGFAGGYAWASSNKVPLRNLNGEIIGLVGITHDITELKQSKEALRRSEKQLRESQQMLQLVLDTIPVRVFWKDRESVYQGCNRLFAEDAGLSQTSQIIGKRDNDLPWETAATRYVNHDGSLISEEHAALDFEDTLDIADGRHMITRMSKLPLLDLEDRIIGVLGVYTDITEQKRIEVALAQKHEEDLEMQMYLKTLHSITIHLNRAETLDDFYRSIVKHGLEDLKFERMGLMLYDTKSDTAVGTYGTDAQGALIPEHERRWKLNDLTRILQRALERRERFVSVQESLLFDRDGQIGTGHKAAVALWNGGPLGWITVDNGVRHQPISKAQLEILALYALTIGPLLARKHTEVALRESEARYRLLAENVRDMIAKLSPQGVITFASPSSYELLGFSPEELVSKVAFNTVHPDDERYIRDAFEKAITTNTPFFTLTLRVQHKNGHYVWLEAAHTVVRSAELGEPLEIIAVLRDITERKKAEDSLRASEDRFRRFVESAPIATVISDQTGRIVLVNRAAEQLFAYNREELLQESIQKLIPASEITTYGEPQMESITADYKHRSENLELSARRKDGSVFPVDMQLSYINMPDGPLMMGFLLDITERKQAEQALMQSLAHERELGELKSRFVSMASHEFRTPLAAILATTETLMVYRDRMDATKIDTRLDKIRDQVMHLKAIIDDVLQLSRVQAGHVQFNPERGDLNAMCYEICEEFENQPAYRGRVKYEANPNPLLVSFDRHLMRQIISNLVSNALKYSPTDKPVHFTLWGDATHIVVKVTDEGIGIPVEDRKHLFEPFHRAANVGTISGTGLGLSITKQAVDLHHGTIALDSQVNSGTTFTVTIPKDHYDGEDTGD